MAAAGAPAEAIALAVEAIEERDSAVAARRAKDAARKREKRKSADTDGNVRGHSTEIHGASGDDTPEVSPNDIYSNPLPNPVSPVASLPPKPRGKRAAGALGLRDRPDDASEQIWVDFLRLRDGKRAPLTATALAGIRREAEVAGWSLDQALTECCERGWQSFKSGWVKGGNGDANGRGNGSGASQSRDGFINAIRESRAIRQARDRGAADDDGMPFFGGMGGDASDG